MTTPHKALLQQALTKLESAQSCHPNAVQTLIEEAIAALTAAIDAPEPYDQQALELCEVCGWKAIVPSEPCLMCERNAKMLAPEPEPVATVDSIMANGRPFISRLPGARLEKGQMLYTHPAPRQPLSDTEVISLAYDCNAMPESCTDKSLIAFAHAIEGKLGVKP